MKKYSLTHLGDQELSRALAAKAAVERTTTADLIAHIAEFDARKLYLPAGYDSMFAYCVQELHFSEDEACKRIRVARAAYRFPAIFDMVAGGGLHLSGLVTLAPYLTEGDAAELLAAATHKKRSEIELLLARRFPRPDLPTRLEPLPAPSAATPAGLSAPGRIETLQSPPLTAADARAR